MAYGSVLLGPPAPNVALVRRTLAHIEAHPQELVSHTYRCRSGMCFAGRACDLAGGRWLTGASHPTAAHLLVAEPADDVDSTQPVGDGHAITTHRRAARLLGLAGEDAARLFDPDNTVDDLRRIVAELCGSVS